MDGQSILALLIVLACGTYLLRSLLRAFSGKGGCASGCGTCPAARHASPVQIAPLEKK